MLTGEPDPALDPAFDADLDPALDPGLVPAFDADLDPGPVAVASRAAAPPATVPVMLAPGRHARRPVGLAGRAGGWLHDRLPPTLQGRVRLGPAHLTVVALLVAVALGVTAWSVLRAQSGEVVPAAAPVSPAALEQPALVTPVAAGAATATAAADATVSGDPAVVVVDVAGRVRRPGIVTLPLGSRVVDALEAAGGARPGVDLTPLNLARVLTDGEQVVVGIAAPGGVAASATSAQSTGGAGAAVPAPLVNLNTATQTELEELPGVGPVTAGAILQWRTEHGPFSAVDELLEVSGIGDATLAEIAPFVTL